MGSLAKIISAIFTYNELKRFAHYYLQTDPEIISIPDDKDEFIYDMLDYFQRRSQLHKVVIGVRQWRPTDPSLYNFVIDIGLAAEEFVLQIYPISILNRFSNQETGISNLREWRLKLATLENQVCLIKIKKDDNSLPIANGTGFLIGNDLLLTNWHVVNDFIDSNGNAKRINTDTITARVSVSLLTSI